MSTAALAARGRYRRLGCSTARLGSTAAGANGLGRSTTGTGANGLGRAGRAVPRRLGRVGSAGARSTCGGAQEC